MADRVTEVSSLTHVLGKLLKQVTYPIPKPCPLPGTSQPDLPYVVVADEAFPSLY